jgi:tRNA (adenine22-N1)-methyltransferase
MNLSERLQHIAGMIPECNRLADVGTDHAYIPIHTTMKKISSTAIASDINKGPIKLAQSNIRKYGLSDKIETRVGPGLTVLKQGEADVVLIAGMGGNLIADILNDSLEVARSTKHLILQPVQYPEVLRKYLIASGFSIIDEDLVKDENKYYHIMKVVNEPSEPFEKEAYYYIGVKLIEKKHPLLKDLLEHKLNLFYKILSQISPEDQPQKYEEIEGLRIDFEDVMKCL